MAIIPLPTGLSNAAWECNTNKLFQIESINNNNNNSERKLKIQSNN